LLLEVVRVAEYRYASLLQDLLLHEFRGFFGYVSVADAAVAAERFSS
jgi:hypothetical protein